MIFKLQEEFIMKEEITIQVSAIIDEVSNREPQKLLAYLAQDIARQLKGSTESRVITIKKPGSPGSRYFHGGKFRRFDEEYLSTYSKQLGLTFDKFYENSDDYYYEFTFNYFEDSNKPKTEVQILAKKIAKHYEQSRRKMMAIAERNTRIEYLNNASKQKEQRRNSYRVYMECVSKLLSHHFQLDCNGFIIIRLKEDVKVDLHRLNMFLARVNLECCRQNYCIVYLRKK